ncbi:neutral/alkaline non-lysosomal ceramidase N-terminal domain-containing protein [Pyrococcus kukulkanii]|nr:neutral/alkaline non-lysosomal ceramidase N-terminal domain-containing protein [Pyrococcus kukulkanii]
MVDNMSILAGINKIEITPNIPMPMAGYALRVGKSEGILDPLYARILTLNSNLEDPIVIISLDLIRVDNELYQEIVAKISDNIGINKDNIIVTATHTHSGPEISIHFWNSIELGPEDVKLIREYRESLIKSILRAMENIEVKEVEGVLAGKVPIHGIASNRIHKEGPIDTECTFLASKNCFLVINYSCHPTVLPATNKKFSGDLAGMISSMLENSLNFNVALYLNGAAGNVSTRFTRRSQSYEEVKRLATLFYSQFTKGLSITTKLKEDIIIDWKTIKLKARRIKKEELDELEEKEKEIYGKLKRLKAEKRSSPKIRILESNYLGLRILKKRINKLKRIRKIKIKIAKLVIGNKLLAVFIPGEPFVEYQLEIKRNSPYEYTMVIGYSNGYFGYFPYPGTQLDTYEVYNSIIDPSEYTKFREEILNFIFE